MLRLLIQRVKFLLLVIQQQKKALSSVENKIFDISNLVQKADYDTKITDIENKLNDHDHDKYIDTSEFNTLTANVFNVLISTSQFNNKNRF